MLPTHPNGRVNWDLVFRRHLPATGSVAVLPMRLQTQVGKAALAAGFRVKTARIDAFTIRVTRTDADPAPAEPKAPNNSTVFWDARKLAEEVTEASENHLFWSRQAKLRTDPAGRAAAAGLAGAWLTTRNARQARLSAILLTTTKP